MDESVYEALIEASRRDGVHDLVVGAYIANESSSILLFKGLPTSSKQISTNCLRAESRMANQFIKPYAVR